MLLKEAIVEVTLRMADEKTIDVAHEMEDKIGWTMTCIRAIEKVNLNTVRKCVLAYPKIADIISPLDPNTRSLPSFVALKDHAVELSRQTITTELSSLQAKGDNLDPQVNNRKKENVLVKLRRLMPGTSNGINALADEMGNITTDPKAITSILKKHWEEVFQKSGIDEDLLSKLLLEEFGEAGNTGLPGYSAWRMKKKTCDQGLEDQW